jgi:hypothetical protein
MIDMVSLDAHRETSRGKGGLSTRDIEALFADCAVNRCSAAPRRGYDQMSGRRTMPLRFRRHLMLHSRQARRPQAHFPSPMI